MKTDLPDGGRFLVTWTEGNLFRSHCVRKRREANALAKEITAAGHYLLAKPFDCGGGYGDPWIQRKKGRGRTRHDPLSGRQYVR